MIRDTEDVVARLHALADRQRRERGDIMYFGEHDPELSQAADLIQSLSDRIDGLEAENAAYRAADERRVEQGKRELEYYYATTCACTAAERYVETCPKHGSRAALHQEGIATGAIEPAAPIA